jgi:hypothetical protein
LSLGYSLPHALLLSGSMVVLSTAVQPSLRLRDRPGALVAVSLALGLPPLISPSSWSSALGWGLALLFPTYPP